MAEFFKEACAEEKQTQSFSGVGAQHPNAETEQDIQTIMYMAWTFMIHGAMNWGEDGSDDLSLWPFTANHAIWLFNWLPQWYSGITPLKMVTQSKMDHHDLMWTHAWGCPVYMLEALLQDGIKLPKWHK